MKQLVCILLFFCSATAGRAQSYELQQLILDVEKLTQFKKILSDMKEGYEILTKGYNAVKDISQGNFNLHKVFLDGLLAVSPTVRNYVKVADIISNQLKLVQEYKAAFKRLQGSGLFNPDEIDYVARVYSHLFDESVDNLGDLVTILTAGSLRMSDVERLTAIDRIDKAMIEKLSFLRQFNSQTAVLSVQRYKEQQSVLGMQKVYGITP